MKNKKDNSMMYLSNERFSSKLLIKNYSIVVIKDDFRIHPQRFLVYYEPTWDCIFFPNYPTVNDKNEQHIEKLLKDELRIQSNIQVQYKGSWTDTKYSVEHKENRAYYHELYEAKISSLPDFARDDTFEHNGRRYYWMTIEQMLLNPQIKEHNRDVVTRVRQFID